MIEKIKGVDKLLEDINFDITLTFKNIYLGTTADQMDPLIPGQTLMEFGIDNQSITLMK